MPTRYSRLSVAWVALAVSVAWVPWEALRLPTSPVVPVAQAASTMPVAQAEQAAWTMPVEPEAQVARQVPMLRVSCQRAVALAQQEHLVLLERWVPKKHPGPWEPQVAWERLVGLVRWARKGHSVQKVEWAPPEH